jgi:Serine-threonine protein phosphatase N-terminal domain
MAETQVDIDDIIARLRAQTGTKKATEVELSEAEAVYLADAALAIVKEQPAVLDLHAPVTLVCVCFWCILFFVFDNCCPSIIACTRPLSV